MSARWQQLRKRIDRWFFERVAESDRIDNATPEESGFTAVIKFNTVRLGPTMKQDEPKQQATNHQPQEEGQ